MRAGLDEDINSIDRQRINQDEARTHFLPANEGKSGGDSRVGGKRRYYKGFGRRRTKHGEDIINEIDVSSDEEESLERRLARLRREIAEVKGEVERQDAATTKASDGETSDKANYEEVDNLDRVLDSIGRFRVQNDKAASERLTQLLSKHPKPRSKQFKSESEEPAAKGEELNAPPYRSDTELSIVSAFDERLSLLEEALGIDALPLPTQEPTPPKSLLPTLDILVRQLNTLSTASNPVLDQIKGRINDLSQEAESLERKRSEAKRALEITGAGGLDPKENGAEDAEQTSKINALYGTLGTIESLAPLLPSVLDRLRSLRDLHSDAASTDQNLLRVEARQEDMKQELQEWKEGLEKVEEAIRQSRETLKGNTGVVETWVKELEERMKKFA